MSPRPLLPEELRRDLFPWVEDKVYLAAAAETPLPTPSWLALRDFAATYRDEGMLGFERHLEELQRCREALARLIGAPSPDDIALVPHTSAGANALAWGLDLQPGERLLAPEAEFPSNLWPWEDAAAAAGARLVRLPASQGHWTPASLLDQAGPGPTPRAIAWSWVQYRDGFRVDLQRLGARARELGAFLAVDAIQGLGVVPLDLAQTPVDALYAGGHKWLLGLGGGGFLYVARGALSKLRSSGRGWLGVADPLAMDIDAPPRKDARRFETGNMALGNYYALRASVELLLKIGVPEIHRHVLALQDALLQALEGSGYRPASCLEPAARSGILSLECPHDAAQVVRALSREGIVATARGGRLRLAPHVYNTFEEMARLAEVLKGLQA